MTYEEALAARKCLQTSLKDLEEIRRLTQAKLDEALVIIREGDIAADLQRPQAVRGWYRGYRDGWQGCDAVAITKHTASTIWVRLAGDIDREPKQYRWKKDGWCAVARFDNTELAVVPDLGIPHTPYRHPRYTGGE